LSPPIRCILVIGMKFHGMRRQPGADILQFCDCRLAGPDSLRIVRTVGIGTVNANVDIAIRVKCVMVERDIGCHHSALGRYSESVN
jgi:hypothetical protein